MPDNATRQNKQEIMFVITCGNSGVSSAIKKYL
jgi:hypothetical protein